MPEQIITRHFARRMLPLAVVAGMLTALTPPVSYRVVAWRQLGLQAEIYAGQLAKGVLRAAEQQPYLWTYNAPKIVRATALHRGQQDIGKVSIHDCSGRAIFGPGEFVLGTGVNSGPTGSAPVLRGDRLLARVDVTMDPRVQEARLLTLTLVFAIMGSMLAFLLYWFPRRVVRRQAGLLALTVRRLEEAEAELTQSNRELAGRVEEAVEQIRRLSSRVLEIQEEERQRIARDLHDGVGQAVTALQIELRLAQTRPQSSKVHLEEAGRLAEEILGEIRTAVFSLRPARLGEMGLEDALRDCVERFELVSETPASLRVEGDLARVSEHVATFVFRMFQEALTNVTRHADAGEVGALVRVERGSLLLKVTDDGKGFGPGGEQKGSGLKGIRERVAYLGGVMKIDSGEGEGTRLEIEIPLLQGK